MQTREEFLPKKDDNPKIKSHFLIRNGIFKLSRNPNYLGEIMVYSSFAILAENQLVWMLFIAIWISLFALRMILKENSLKLKHQWLII